MKSFFVAVTTALLLAGSGWAQTNSFQVDISGTITRDTDRFSVKTVNLLSSPSNIMVMTTMGTNKAICSGRMVARYREFHANSRASSRSTGDGIRR